MRALLIFREVALARMLGQRRKFSLADSENPDRQVCRKIDTSDQKNCPENDVRTDRDDAKRQISDRHSQNGALYQCDHRGERQHGSADCRSPTRKKLPFHLVVPAQKFIVGIDRSRRIERMRLLDAGPVIGDKN
jgi:hypothetical protein